MVDLFTLPISITIFCICLIFGLSTLFTYMKEKDKVALYLSTMFLVLAISSLIYMFFIIDFLIKGVLITEGNFLLGFSQYVGTTASLFALYFGVELGKKLGDISAVRPKRIGIVIWIFISIWFIPYLIGILLGYNIFELMTPLIPTPDLIMFSGIFFLAIVAYGVPVVQFNKLRKIALHKNRQIITILFAYIVWIISFNFLGMAMFFEYVPDPTLGHLISLFEIIGYILQMLSLSLFFLGIYLPKIGKF